MQRVHQEIPNMDKCKQKETDEFGIIETIYGLFVFFKSYPGNKYSM